METEKQCLGSGFVVVNERHQRLPRLFKTSSGRPVSCSRRPQPSPGASPGVWEEVTPGPQCTSRAALTSSSLSRSPGDGAGLGMGLVAGCWQEQRRGFPYGNPARTRGHPPCPGECHPLRNSSLRNGCLTEPERPPKTHSLREWRQDQARPHQPVTNTTDCHFFSWLSCLDTPDTLPRVGHRPQRETEVRQPCAGIQDGDLSRSCGNPGEHGRAKSS